MAKLNDTHLVLLSHAAKNDLGSLYPLPAAADADISEKMAKAIEQLVSRGLVEERETTGSSAIYRTEGDRGYGVFITAIGLTVIGIDDDAATERSPEPARLTAQPKTGTKTDAVLALLKRAEGATLVELIEVTGWLPHTTRAALTGLRKKGHAIEKSKRDEATCYRVAA